MTANGLPELVGRAWLAGWLGVPARSIDNMVRDNIIPRPVPNPRRGPGRGKLWWRMTEVLQHLGRSTKDSA